MPHIGQVTRLSVAVPVGSRHELPGQEGLAHFIEHALFKGCDKYSARQVLTRLDSVGGELNAYTTREETVLTAACLDEHIDRAIDLLAHLLFRPTFPDPELDREREVIQDEIAAVEDTPSDLVCDRFDQLYFRGSPLAHPILGSSDNVAIFGSAHCRSFHQRHYRRPVLVVSTQRDNEEIARSVERYFAPLLPPALAGDEASGTDSHGTDADNSTTVDIKRQQPLRARQAHVVIGGPAPNATDQNSVHAVLLAYLLGGPANNALLSVALREKNGIGYNVEANYNDYRDHGQLTIYYGTDAANLARARSVVKAVTERLCDKPLSERAWNNITMQWLAQLKMSIEDYDERLAQVTRAALLFPVVPTFNEWLAAVPQRLSPQALQGVAQQAFHSPRLREYTLD